MSYYNHVVLTPQPKVFMPMSSTCQILCVTARLTWRCPTCHSNHAMAPVKHTVHEVSRLFLPWDLLWYLLLCPDICACSLLPHSRREAVLLCRSQKCLLPFCKTAQLEKLICPFCSLELQLCPGTG